MWPSVHLPATDIVISTYHLLHVVGWFAFLLVGLRLTLAWPELRHHWWWLFIGMALSDTVGAHAFASVIRGGHGGGFWGAPLLIALWTGFYVVARRIRAYPMLDVFAIAFSVSQVFEKLACLAAGCCFGRPTTSVLGVTLLASRDDPTRRLPLPLCESSLHLLTAFGLTMLYTHGLLKGRLVMVLGILFGIWRAIVESARPAPNPSLLNGPITITQMICVLSAVFGATYLILDWAETRRKARTRPEGNTT